MIIANNSQFFNAISAPDFREIAGEPICAAPYPTDGQYSQQGVKIISRGAVSRGGLVHQPTRLLLTVSHKLSSVL